MEAKIIAVAIQKGGTSKSTTALALTAGLTLKGYKVLAIDLDSQGNLSGTARANKDGVTSLELLTRKTQAKDAIQKTEIGDVIPSNRTLAGADAFISETGKEYRLREALETIKHEYDYIILDTPPALGILTINALTACHSVVIPAQADLYSLESIEELAETIKPVKRYTNPNLSIAGIVLTRYSPRFVLSKDVLELAKQLAVKLDTKVFNTTIREAVAVKESQINRQSLFAYAPNANVTEDYAALINEIIAEV